MSAALRSVGPIAQAVATVIILGLFILGAYALLADVLAERSLGPDLRIPACTTEDDPGPCYWDADTRGNGEGESFIVLDGVLYTPEVTP